MPPKVQKSKEAKMKAAMSGGGKGKKKKWSKGKMREKANNLVLLDPSTKKKIWADLPKQKLITVATMVERFKTGGSISRRLLRVMADEGLIKTVCSDARMQIYTGTQIKADDDEEVDDGKKKKKKK